MNKIKFGSAPNVFGDPFRKDWGRGLFQYVMIYQDDESSNAGSRQVPILTIYQFIRGVCIRRRQFQMPIQRLEFLPYIFSF